MIYSAHSREQRDMARLGRGLHSGVDEYRLKKKKNNMNSSKYCN